MARTFQYQRLAVPILPVVAPAPVDVPAFDLANDAELPIRLVWRFRPEMQACTPTILYQPQVPIVPLRVYDAAPPLPVTARRFHPENQQASPTILPANLPPPNPTPKFVAAAPNPVGPPNYPRAFQACHQQAYAKPDRAILPYPVPGYPAANPNPLTFFRFTTADQQTYAAPSKQTLAAPPACLLPTGELPPATLRRFRPEQQAAWTGKPLGSVIPPAIPLVQSPFIQSKRPQLPLISGVFQASAFLAPSLSWSPPVFQPFQPRKHRTPHEQTAPPFQLVVSAPAMSWSPPQQQPFQPRKHRVASEQFGSPLGTIAPPIPKTSLQPPFSPKRQTITLPANVIVTVNEKTQVAALFQMPAMLVRRRPERPDQLPAMVPISWTTPVPPDPTILVCDNDIAGLDNSGTASVIGYDNSGEILFGLDLSDVDITGNC